MGWRLHIVNAGVSDTDGTSAFCHVDKGGRNNEQGFTAAPQIQMNLDALLRWCLSFNWLTSFDSMSKEENHLPQSAMAVPM
jgi:hypothetical protein